MEKKHYDKAIRDQIPEIMEQADVAFEVEILDSHDFEQALRVKLVEEATEAAEAASRQDLTKELADVLEVVHAIADYANITPSELEEVRMDRANKRGAFKERLFLRWTSEKSNR